MPSVQNIHGRKPGRGIRPWILLPKYFAVSLIIGGIFSAGVLAAISADIELIARIFRLQIIPATAAAIVLGIALFLLHAKPFWHMRWFRLKLALVVGLVPLMHLTAWLAVHEARQQQRYLGVMGRPLTSALAAFIIIAAIGRLKPRLGQPYSTKAS